MTFITKYILCVILLIITFTDPVINNCGKPATHPDLLTNKKLSSGTDQEEINYMCNEELDKFNDQYRMAYLEYRVCQNGSWMSRAPKCAQPIPIEVTGVNVLYPLTDLKSRISQTSNIEFNSTKKIVIDINIKRAQRISFIEFEFSFDIQPNDLNFSLYLNDYRNCILNPFYPELDEDFEFVCEAKSHQHYEKEAQNLPSSFSITIASDRLFKVSLGNVNIFQLNHTCGTPDLPQFAIEKNSNDEYFEIDIDPKEHRFKKRKDGIYKIKCLYEGNWDTELSDFEPIVMCSLDKFDFNSKYYLSHKRLKFETNNGLEVAVIDSSIEFLCNSSIDFNITFNAICNDKGTWDYAGLPCDPNFYGEAERSNVSTVIISLSGSLILLIIIVVIIGVIVWFKIVKKRNIELEIEENYDDIINQTDKTVDTDYEEVVDYNTNNYELVNYQDYQGMESHKRNELVHYQDMESRKRNEYSYIEPDKNDEGPYYTMILKPQ